MADLSLVTGATGFLGRTIVRQLVERGQRVRILVRREDRELASLGVEQVTGDVRDRKAVVAACRGVDVVHHTAGVAGIWGPWRHFHEINTLGTENIVAACLTEHVPRLVYTSSPSVTFDGTTQEGVDESAPYPTRWLCHYPHSKALAEQQLLAANSDSLKTCSLRPHLIWGPGDRHLIPRLLARARGGTLRRIGDGTNLIDMVYVDNAAHAHLLAAEALRGDAPAAGRAYFISQGEPVNCWQWIDDILGLAGHPPVRRSLSLKTAWRIGAVLEGVHAALGLPGEPRMTRFLAAQLGLSHYFNIDRARRDLGYEPVLSTEAGMARLRKDINVAR